MKLLVLTFITIGIVECLSDLFIYGQFIVPMLPTVESVPFYWWALLFLPSVIFCLFIGAKAKSYKQTVILAVAGSIAAHIYNLIAAINHFPGHGKSWALEGPLVWWSAGLALQAAFYSVLMAVGFIAYKNHAKQCAAT